MTCPKCEGELILVGTCYNSDPTEDQFKCERCGRMITITRLGAYE